MVTYRWRVTLMKKSKEYGNRKTIKKERRSWVGGNSQIRRECLWKRCGNQEFKHFLRVENYALSQRKLKTLWVPWTSSIILILILQWRRNVLLRVSLKFIFDIKLKSKNVFSINNVKPASSGRTWKCIKIQPHGSPVFSFSGTGMEKIFWFFI